MGNTGVPPDLVYPDVCVHDSTFLDATDFSDVREPLRSPFSRGSFQIYDFLKGKTSRSTKFQSGRPDERSEIGPKEVGFTRKLSIPLRHNHARNRRIFGSLWAKLSG